jgi:hypothetical protein
LEVVWTPSWIHSALLIVMIVLILTGRRSGVYETRRRATLERAALRAALVAELTALRGVYRLNFELIAAGAPGLMSGRAYFSVYRGNMMRLMTLTAPEVAAVVGAHAASELLDAAVLVGNRMRARHPDGLAWQARRFDVKRLHRAARASAEEAVAALEEAAVTAAAPRRWAGLRLRWALPRWRFGWRRAGWDVPSPPDPPSSVVARV